MIPVDHLVPDATAAIDGTAVRARYADSRRHRAVRLRRHRHQHHAGRRGRRVTRRPGPPFAHTDLSGDLDRPGTADSRAERRPAGGTIDLTGTSAIGSLTRLRAQCRGAKERLSTSPSPPWWRRARLPRRCSADPQRAGRRDPRTVGRLRRGSAGHLERNGVRDLVAVASVGGGARIPITTTTLSEHFRVPVITSGQPELTAAIGGGLTAVRGTVDDQKTSIGGRRTSGRGSRDDDGTRGGGAAGRDAAIGHVRRARVVGRRRCSGRGADRSVRLLRAGRPGRCQADVRPQMQFHHEPQEHERAAAPLPWYRRPEVAMGAGVVVVLVALGAAVLFVMRSGETPPAPASTTVTTHRTATDERRASAAGDAGTAAGDRHAGGAAAGDPDGDCATAARPSRRSPIRRRRPPSRRRRTLRRRPPSRRSPIHLAGGHRAAAARRTDAAVRDHSRSAVRSGTDSTATTGSVGTARPSLRSSRAIRSVNQAVPTMRDGQQ